MSGVTVQWGSYSVNFKRKRFEFVREKTLVVLTLSGVGSREVRKRNTLKSKGEKLPTISGFSTRKERCFTLIPKNEAGEGKGEREGSGY